MIPAPVDYVRPDSIADAIDQLAAAEDTAVLAGGQGLVNRLKAREERPDRLVDIGRLEALTGIEDDEDGSVAIGALVTHRRAAESALVAERLPGLADATSQLGDRQVRNRGTVVGNLVERDAGADPPAVALAHRAELDIRGQDGRRRVSVEDLVGGDVRIAADELVTAVRFPDTFTTGAYTRRTHPATGYAMVGVATAIAREDETITDISVTATGVTDLPTRLGPAEAVLRGEPLAESAIAAAADVAPEGIDPDATVGDHHASGAYRRSLLAPQVRTTLRSCLDRLDAEGRR